MRERLGDAKLVVVANREPYIHVYDGSEIRCMRPASGLTTALDPVMRACGGVWVAHGSGNADRVDDRRAATASPCRRKTRPTPCGACGSASGKSRGTTTDSRTKPSGRCATWPTPGRDSAPAIGSSTSNVNAKFAEAVLAEVGDGPAVVFVQDYHLALLPRMLKNARDDLVVAQFWHIPWPNREVFRVCPWQDEILDGLLGQRPVGVSHPVPLQQLSGHHRPHLGSQGGLGALLRDPRRADDAASGRTRSASTPSWCSPTCPLTTAAAERRLRRRLGLRRRADSGRRGSRRLHQGHSRALCRRRLSARNSTPSSRAPSASCRSARRAASTSRPTDGSTRNWRRRPTKSTGVTGKEPGGRSIFVNEHYDPQQVFELYRIAAGCVVSSLHDGMNLVAKEFVASRDDGQGVLILSQFTGAARELTDALQINPYATDEFADALYAALTMPPEEQQHRMARMRQQISRQQHLPLGRHAAVGGEQARRHAGSPLESRHERRSAGRFATGSATPIVTEARWCCCSTTTAR